MLWGTHDETKPISTIETLSGWVGENAIEVKVGLVVQKDEDVESEISHVNLDGGFPVSFLRLPILLLPCVMHLLACFLSANHITPW